MKYTVRASKSGYAEIEANSEEEALEKAWCADYNWEEDVYDMEIVDEQDISYTYMRAVVVKGYRLITESVDMKRFLLSYT